MDRLGEWRPRPTSTRANAPAQESEPDRVVVFPSLRTAGLCQARRTQYVSDSEIAQLVSVALEDALLALGQTDPEKCLRLRAYEARAGIREMLSALPHARARDPKVLKEYRRAMVLQNLGLELALNLVGSIRRYARIYEREIPARLA